MDPRLLTVLTDERWIHVVLHPLLEFLRDKGHELSTDLHVYLAEASSTSKGQPETKKLFDTLSTGTWSLEDKKSIDNILKLLEDKK